MFYPSSLLRIDCQDMCSKIFGNCLLIHQIFFDIYGANKSKIDSILVHFIQIDVNEKIGIKRHIEKIILYFYKFNKKQQKLNNVINGVTYE